MNLSDKIISRLKLTQLRIILAIDEFSTFKGAAKSLGISQPLVTKKVKDLELDFGVELFERSNQGVTPTSYGEALINNARIIISQVKRTGEEISDLSAGLGGRVKVGVLVAAEASIISVAIAEMNSSRPNVLINVIDGDYNSLIPELQKGELHLIVGRQPQFGDYEGLKYERLHEEEIVVAVRPQHPLANKKNVSLEMLLDWDWILPARKIHIRQKIENTFDEIGLAYPRCAVESILPFTNQKILKNSNLIGIFPAFAIQDEFDAKTLYKIPVNISPNLDPVVITTLKNIKTPPAVSAFIDEIRVVSKSI